MRSQTRSADNAAKAARGAGPTGRCAILFADLAGYTALMSRDEPATLDFMVQCSDLATDLCARTGGTIAQTLGDGFLILFAQAVQALDFGLEFHRHVARRQVGSKAIAKFRIGIHLGDVHRVNGAVYGHAINIAARLQEEALPGAIVLSEAVYDEVRGLRDLIAEPLGQRPLKNVQERIALFQVSDAGLADRAGARPAALVALVGPLSVTFAGRPVWLPAHSRTAAILGYLALASGSRHRIEKIVSLIWPDQGDRSRRSFSACRRKLAAALADIMPNSAMIAQGHIGLDELDYDTDLGLAERDLRRGRVPALFLSEPDWPERILEGFDDISPVYASWLSVVRATWRSRAITALSEIMARGDADSARDAAQAILAIDPGNEAASAVLIRYFVSRHNRTAALVEYRRLEDHLKRWHGIAPDPFVAEALHVDPLPAAPAVVPSQTASPRLIRLRVGLFACAIDKDAHLVEGFRNDLLANLARFREWSVNEAGGSAVNGGQAAPGPSAAAAGYQLDGEYLRTPAGPRLRVKLRDDGTQRIVWSADHEIRPMDWIDLQRTIAGRIAAHVDTYISADRTGSTLADGHDALSHDVWLRAEQIFARWTPAAATEAEAMLQALVARDDRFAPAYSSLAGFRNVQHVINPGRPRDAAGAREAHALAQRAVELDPLDARNQLALAWTAALTEAFDRAAIHLDLAAMLNPNSTATLISCAMGYAFAGQPDRAETLVAHVLRIAPLLREDHWCYLAAVHFLAGRHEEALKAARRSGDRIVDNPGWTAAALARLGRMDEARAEFDRLIDAVRPIWAGPGAPTAEAVFDWFTTAYPLRRDTDRTELREALGAAMRGQ